MLKTLIVIKDINIDIWSMPLNNEIPSVFAKIDLEAIRKFYFEHTKHTLRIEDAKYLLERANELNITSQNGGLEALFKTLKYNFESQEIGKSTI